MSQVIKNGHNPKFHHAFITRYNLARITRLLVRLALNLRCQPPENLHAQGRAFAYLQAAKIVGYAIREVQP